MVFPRSMPGPKKAVLSEKDRRRLHAALERIEKAEQEFADLVRELGIAPSAREMDLTPQGLLHRVQVIEAREAT